MIAQLGKFKLIDGGKKTKLPSTEPACCLGQYLIDPGKVSFQTKSQLSRWK
jgi:hypothetical protein